VRLIFSAQPLWGRKERKITEIVYTADPVRRDAASAALLRAKSTWLPGDAARTRGGGAGRRSANRQCISLHSTGFRMRTIVRQHGSAKRATSCSSRASRQRISSGTRVERRSIRAIEWQRQEPHYGGTPRISPASGRPRHQRLRSENSSPPADRSGKASKKLLAECRDTEAASRWAGLPNDLT